MLLPLVAACQEDALLKSPYVSVKKTVTVTVGLPPPLSVAVENGATDALSLTARVLAIVTDGAIAGVIRSVADALAP